MTTRGFENNTVTVSGVITQKFTFNHMTASEAFYRTEIAVARKSGTVDMIPLMVSERLVTVTEDWSGKVLEVTGSFRSYNQNEGDRRRLMLFVFAQEVELLEENENINEVFLDGHICKAPTYRKTPLGREICDMLVAVNRPNDKSDYIPCVIWGRAATFASRLEVGTGVQLWGRLQSRVYTKRLDETHQETRVAYEFSVNKIGVKDAHD